MGTFNSYCDKCGWTSGITSSPPTLGRCPVCDNVACVTNLDELYQHHFIEARCSSCGWESGPTKVGLAPSRCPSCDYPCLEKHHIPGTQGQQKEVSNLGLILVFGGIGIILAPMLLFYPGCMITMLCAGGDVLDSKFLAWLSCIGISLVAFVLTGCNVKRYLILDGVLLGVCALIAFFSDFAPFTYSMKLMWGI